jgi:hypothetical protein
MKALSSATEKSARENNYNLNLLGVLTKLEAAKKIKIEEIKYDFLAHRPNLAGTVIVWRPDK